MALKLGDRSSAMALKWTDSSPTMALKFKDSFPVMALKLGDTFSCNGTEIKGTDPLQWHWNEGTVCSMVALKLGEVFPTMALKLKNNFPCDEAETLPSLREEGQQITFCILNSSEIFKNYESLT